MSDLPLSASFTTDLGTFSLFRDQDYQNAQLVNQDGTSIWEKVNGSDSVLDSIGYTSELEGLVNNDFLTSIGIKELIDTPVDFNPPDESTGEKKKQKHQLQIYVKIIKQER